MYTAVTLKIVAIQGNALFPAAFQSRNTCSKPDFDSRFKITSKAMFPDDFLKNPYEH